MIDNLTAYIPTALESNETVGVFSFVVAGYYFDISCTIPAGSTSCTATGPSGTIAAGTPLVFGATAGSATQVSFSYELSTPGVTVPAAKHPVKLLHFAR